MIIKRIPAVAPPPPVKRGDPILVIEPHEIIASARVHEASPKMFSAYVWNVDLRYYLMDDEGTQWCRDVEPTASAFRTVVALRKSE